MNRKSVVSLLLLALALPWFALAQTGGAAPAVPAAVPVKVGIINLQLAIAASNEGQRDFGALQKKFEPKQTELSNLNKEVEELKKQLNTQGDKLNEEARANLVKSIEQKQKVLQRGVEDAQSDFRSQQNEVAGRIYTKMVDVLDKYAKSNGYAVILNFDDNNPQNPILWAGQSVDVTRAIVEAYNVESGVPAPPPPAASATPGAAPTGTGSNPPPRRPASTNPPR